MPSPSRALCDALVTDSPSPDRADALALYAPILGSWIGRVVHHDLGGLEVSCELHCSWILEGRALQDVWITPRRGERPAEGLPPGADWYGTTLRVYQPRRDAWDVTWTDPATGWIVRMEDLTAGKDIVQSYRWPNGTRCQWVFMDIDVDSFRWVRRESLDGETWEVKTEIFFRRDPDGRP